MLATCRWRPHRSRFRISPHTEHDRRSGEMIGLPEAAVAAVRDPLVVTLAVLLLGGLLTHLLFRRHPLSRATLRVIFLVILTVVLLHAGVVPYELQTRTGVTVPGCRPCDPKDRVVAMDCLVSGRPSSRLCRYRA